MEENSWESSCFGHTKIKKKCLLNIKVELSWQLLIRSEGVEIWESFVDRWHLNL